MKSIKFKADSTTNIGSIVVHYSTTAKFWKVYKIVNGVAFAKANGF